MVQATSSKVLCVVLDGVGLALSLKRTAQTTNKAKTNRQITVMIGINTQLYIEWIRAATSVTASWNPSCPGSA